MRNSNKYIHCVGIFIFRITKCKIIYILRFYIRLYHRAAQMSTDLSLVKQALPNSERLLFVYPSLLSPNRSVKNWLFNNTERGTKCSAILYSIISTAQANGLDAEKYLIELFSHPPAQFCCRGRINSPLTSPCYPARFLIFVENGGLFYAYIMMAY